MHSIRAIYLLAVVLLSLMLPGTITACKADRNNGGKLLAAVSILPQASLIKAVGGDRVEVVVMVPPGASPHTYEVTPTQMSRLAKARLYAKVGAPVEFELVWMDKLLAVNKKMQVIDCAQGIELMAMTEEDHHENETETESEHEHHGLDPHIWLSLRNVKIMTQNICDGLIQTDPDNKIYYENNRDSYLAELDKLDKDLKADLANITNRNFIVVHPSFGYFARDYNLTQIALEQGGKEPEADYMVRLIKKAKELAIKVIFVSPQYSTRSAEILAKEIGGEVVQIDPLAEDLVNNIKSIGAALKQAMR